MTKANAKYVTEKVLTKEKRLENKRFSINDLTRLNFKLLILNKIIVQYYKNIVTNQQIY